jgi:hypothetical protein
MPDVAPTVATEVVEDAHVPPVTVLVSGDDAPMHIAATPLIGAGMAFTVITVVAVDKPHEPDTK